MEKYIEEKEFSSVEELVGKSLNIVINHDNLDRNHKIVSKINPDLCINCHSCYIACKTGGYNAIIINDNEQPEVDEEKCRGCGLCVTVCPTPNLKLRTLS